MGLLHSYTQADRAWAEWIAWALEEDEHHILVQAWNSAPASNRVSGLRAGTGAAARTIVVLSCDYLTSVYGGAEWQAAWAGDPGEAGRKLHERALVFDEAIYGPDHPAVAMRLTLLAHILRDLADPG